MSVETDVLIIGAGPSGCMLAACLSRLGVDFRIIDKNATATGVGHADGFQCRTVEVFDSLGVAHLAVHQGTEVAEFAFYERSAEGDMRLVQRIPDTDAGLSHFRHILLAQGKVERILSGVNRDHDGPEVERLTTVDSIDVDEHCLQDPNAHPFNVTLRRLERPTEEISAEHGLHRSNAFVDPNAPIKTTQLGTTEEVRCKYVIGCDGARSWTRQWLGFELKGEMASTYWGVIDARPITDLPTIRCKNAITSDAGSLLTVPRERHLVRFYIQLGVLEEGQRINRDEVTLERIQQQAKQIVAPYNLDFGKVEWWTCYVVAQRLCDQFSAHNEHVFLIGDATHVHFTTLSDLPRWSHHLHQVHSPKAGQGMNVSMMDSYNLAWKLAACIHGKARPEILKTYDSERRQVAQELIEFDHKFSRSFGGKSTGLAEEESYRNVWMQAKKWTSGTAVRYHASLLIDDTPVATRLARNVTVGAHLQSYQVVNVASFCPIQLQKRLVSDGHWRLILFAGDVTDPPQRDRINAFCIGAAELVSRYGANSLECLTVTSCSRLDFDFLSLPEVLIPKDSRGFRTYDTVFSDEESTHEGHGHAYSGYGIDHKSGCVVLVRPDQYVAGVYELEESDNIAHFLSKFMVSAQ